MEESKKEFNKTFTYELKLRQNLARQKEINDELEIKEEGEELVVADNLPEQVVAR